MSGRITTVSKPPKLERKKRVAAYARVSSGKDAMLHSLSAQVSHYSDLIQRNSDWLYAGVYADEAKTGTKDSRADFQRLPVPANLFAGTSSNSRTGNNESAATQQPTAPLHDSEVTAASFLSLEASSDVQAIYWFEMRASTGGSRNILDLSSSAKLQSGTHPNVENGSIPGSVAFFGLDPMARDVEKNVTIVYNGISYYPSTIKFAPNNASWRIQLKGDAETGDESLSQYGKTDFAYHILVFHRVTSDHYILETMAESELDALKANSEFWATNGINKSSKAFGKIRIG